MKLDWKKGWKDEGDESLRQSRTVSYRWSPTIGQGDELKSQGVDRWSDAGA